MNKYLFFWDGPFSNWHPSTFSIDGIKYNCGEQYMMYQKALLFNDEETARQILLKRIPIDQKMLGRQVKNFDAAKWNELSFELVKKGLREKFKQNALLKSELFNNRYKIIVEASPYDRIWGIGYREENALVNINNWGENRLGKILTELAQEL